MMGELPSDPSWAGPTGPPVPESRKKAGGEMRLAKSSAAESETIFAPAALEFLARLARRFGPRREALLAERTQFSESLRRGAALRAPAESWAIRDSDWRVAPPPPGLETRWVELLGAPEARTIVQGLNSKANVFVADFEDLLSPTWDAIVRGHLNLTRAVQRSLEYSAPNGDRFRIARQPATIMVRPRGWHLVELHALVDGQPIPAPLFDFGVYVFHNARDLLRTGTGPYFYLSKLEHYPEAALWEEVFEFAEGELDLRRGTIRATAAIETVPAVVEMDEILFAMRAHSAGLGFGLPGYAFSFLKQIRNETPRAPPTDWTTLGVGSPFAASSSHQLLAMCRRRGAQAISSTPVYLLGLEHGGPGDPEVGRELAEKVRAAHEGYDGTWAVHPGAVPAVREFFRTRRPSAGGTGPAASATPERSSGPDAVDAATVTFNAVRSAVRASLRYFEARLRGVGTVIVDHRVEDASTVEISRTLLWTWVHGNQPTSTGGTVSAALVREILGEEIDVLLLETAGDAARTETVGRASVLVDQLATDRSFPEYLSLLAVPD
jgi:malate synthase